MYFIKPLVFFCSLLPIIRLIWLGFDGDLGANPIEFITRSTGTWALVFLCLTLTMTPLRVLTGLSIWIKLRRMLGLFVFFYASLHFAIWLWLDQNLDLIAMLRDVVKRPFISMGFLSYVLLTPLAMTSNRFSQKRLGRKWALLHRLVYVIACSVILHYWWHKAGKNDLSTVSISAAIIFVLLAARFKVVKNWLSRVHGQLKLAK